MSLNISNRQIAQELDLNISSVHKITQQLRGAVYQKRPDVTLSGEVECDEVYIVAGHKGHPKEVKKRSARAPKQVESGAMVISLFVMVTENTPAMKTMMVSMKFM